MYTVRLFEYILVSSGLPIHSIHYKVHLVRTSHGQSPTPKSFRLKHLTSGHVEELLWYGCRNPLLKCQGNGCKERYLVDGKMSKAPGHVGTVLGIELMQVLQGSITQQS